MRRYADLLNDEECESLEEFMQETTVNAAERSFTTSLSKDFSELRKQYLTTASVLCDDDVTLEYAGVVVIDEEFAALEKEVLCFQARQKQLKKHSEVLWTNKNHRKGQGGVTRNGFDHEGTKDTASVKNVKKSRTNGSPSVAHCVRSELLGKENRTLAPVPDRVASRQVLGEYDKGFIEMLRKQKIERIQAKRSGPFLTTEYEDGEVVLELDFKSLPSKLAKMKKMTECRRRRIRSVKQRSTTEANGKKTKPHNHVGEEVIRRDETRVKEANVGQQPDTQLHVTRSTQEQKTHTKLENKTPKMVPDQRQLKITEDSSESQIKSKSRETSDHPGRKRGPSLCLNSSTIQQTQTDRILSPGSIQMPYNLVRRGNAKNRPNVTNGSDGSNTNTHHDGVTASDNKQPTSRKSDRLHNGALKTCTRLQKLGVAKERRDSSPVEAGSDVRNCRDGEDSCQTTDQISSQKDTARSKRKRNLQWNKNTPNIGEKRDKTCDLSHEMKEISVQVDVPLLNRAFLPRKHKNTNSIMKAVEVDEDVTLNDPKQENGMDFSNKIPVDSFSPNNTGRFVRKSRRKMANMNARKVEDIERSGYKGTRLKNPNKSALKETRSRKDAEKEIQSDNMKALSPKEAKCTKEANLTKVNIRPKRTRHKKERGNTKKDTRRTDRTKTIKKGIKRTKQNATKAQTLNLSKTSQSKHKNPSQGTDTPNMSDGRIEQSSSEEETVFDTPLATTLVTNRFIDNQEGCARCRVYHFIYDCD